MRVLITGRPGTGKSTVTEALSKQGYVSFDLEEVPGVVRLEIKETGEPVDWPTGYVDWDYYAWNIQPKPLHDLLDQHAAGDMYVTVSASNLADFYSFFDKVFALTVDSPATLRHRLETRQVHEFNQGAKNIDHAIAHYEARTAQYVREGCIPIDNSRPVGLVIAEIVRLTHE